MFFDNPPKKKKSKEKKLANAITSLILEYSKSGKAKSKGKSKKRKGSSKLSKVMKKAQKFYRSGDAADMSEAMQMAWDEV